MNVGAGARLEPARRLFVACDLPPEVASAVGRWQSAELGQPLFLPQGGAKRVVALPLDDPTGALAATQRVVSACLTRRRLYAPGQRPWLAHLTVARFRRPGHPFSLQNVTISGFGLPSVILYASLLERGGAVHTPLATFPTSA